MKKCPFCGEEIQNDAIKCRYCGEFVTGRKQPCIIDLPSDTDDKQSQSNTNPTRNLRFKRIAVLGSTAIILGIALTLYVRSLGRDSSTQQLPVDKQAEAASQLSESTIAGDNDAIISKLSNEPEIMNIYRACINDQTNTGLRKTIQKNLDSTGVLRGGVFTGINLASLNKDLFVDRTDPRDICIMSNNYIVFRDADFGNIGTLDKPERIVIHRNLFSNAFAHGFAQLGEDAIGLDAYGPASVQPSSIQSVTVVYFKTKPPKIVTDAYGNEKEVSPYKVRPIYFSFMSAQNGSKLNWQNLDAVSDDTIESLVTEGEYSSKKWYCRDTADALNTDVSDDSQDAQDNSTQQDVHENSKGPSYDCTEAKTRVEHIICESDKLSQADREMASLYNALLKSSPSAKHVRVSQNEWRNNRDKCTDEECLTKAYEHRIEELEQGQAPAPIIGQGTTAKQLEDRTVPETAQIKESDGDYEQGTSDKPLRVAPSDPEYLKYQAMLRGKIMHEWIVPQAYVESGSNLNAQLGVTINSNGEVVSTNWAKTSGDAAFDQSVIHAVRKASPFPKPSERLAWDAYNEGFLIEFTPRLKTQY